MPTKWVVVADACRARIFETQALGRGMREVQDLANPTGRLHTRDLIVDALGRSHANGTSRTEHATAPRTDPVDHEVEVFAKRVADQIERARVEGRFERLYVVAAPRILGLLRDKRSKDTERLVEKEIAKDMAQLDPAAIAAQIWG